MSEVIEKFKPDFESEFEHAIDVLEQYLTSTTLEEAYQTLKQNQEVLLSETIRLFLEKQIAERTRIGDHRNAEKLELHLYLFEEIRIRGLDAAWKTFKEDDE